MQIVATSIEGWTDAWTDGLLFFSLMCFYPLVLAFYCRAIDALVRLFASERGVGL